MKEPLDQHDLGTRANRNYLKLLNTVLLVLSLSVVFFFVWRIWDAKNSMSPYLPEYTIYHMYGTLINFTAILSVGILPGLIFRAMKHHSTSSFVLIAFSVLGFIFDDRVEIYKFFY